VSANEPDFSVGSLVRVRWGARSSIYPDLPLGGWTGTVCGQDGELRLVHVTGATLALIDACFRERLEAGIWLRDDQLEADPGEPLLLEQFLEEDHARTD
jgi:hypothetical protein